MRTAISLLGLTLLIVLVGTWMPNPARADGGGAPKQVAIDNFSFNASTVEVSVGTQVTWVNHDDVPHNVVSVDRAFASPVLDTDERFSQTFDRAGEHKYYCSIHPRMTGTVVVK